jgi:hypothetical protein
MLDILYLIFFGTMNPVDTSITYFSISNSTNTITHEISSLIMITTLYYVWLALTSAVALYYLIDIFILTIKTKKK